MKHFFLLLLLILFITPVLTALSGEIVYVEGTVDIRPSGGDLEWAEIGMSLNEGDTLITGVDGYCEVALQGDSSIKLEADTVFTYQRASLKPDEEPQSIFRVVLGQVRYKFGQLTGREPAVATTSSVCGIRGTEFSVIASADGSSLYVLTQGEVAISSGGMEVALLPDEGVEVTSTGLGDKFPTLQGSIDFSDWRSEADARALEDPLGTLVWLTTLMMEYLEEADYYYDLYIEYKEQMDQASEEIKVLREEGLEEEAQIIVDDRFLPLKQDVLTLILNYRYYAISLLSLRQYSVSTLYIQQRTAHWGEELPTDFNEAYQAFLGTFEERAISYYETRDI